MPDLERYSVINEKNPREIVLLRASGCKWKRCTFCDYHLDYSEDEQANFLLNKRELQKVRGIYGCLEVINSGSFCDLDEATMQEIESVCIQKHIQRLHFECHWMHRNLIPALKARFAAIGITVFVKIGVETFDRTYRETILKKGIGTEDPAKISELFDECCLLFGLSGQTVDSMQKDIETGLRYFNRVCVNIMVENSTPIKPDDAVIHSFCTYIEPLYRNNPRVDILLQNTDFGVG